MDVVTHRLMKSPYEAQRGSSHCLLAVPDSPYLPANAKMGKEVECKVERRRTKWGLAAYS